MTQTQHSWRAPSYHQAIDIKHQAWLSCHGGTDRHNFGQVLLFVGILGIHDTPHSHSWKKSQYENMKINILRRDICK